MTNRQGRTASALVWAVIACGALAGCSSDMTEPIPTTPPSTTPAPTAPHVNASEPTTSTPEPTPSDEPALEVDPCTPPVVKDVNVSYGNAFNADYPDGTELSSVEYTVANIGSEAFWLYEATITLDLRPEGDRHPIGYLADDPDGLVEMSGKVVNPFDAGQVLIEPGRQFTQYTALFGDFALGTAGGDAPVTVTVSPGQYVYDDETLNSRCGLR